MVLGVDLWKCLSMFPGPCCLHPGGMTLDKGVHWAGVGSLVLEMAATNVISTWHPPISFSTSNPQVCIQCDSSRGQQAVDGTASLDSVRSSDPRLGYTHVPLLVAIPTECL